MLEEDFLFLERKVMGRLVVLRGNLARKNLTVIIIVYLILIFFTTAIYLSGCGREKDESTKEGPAAGGLTISFSGTDILIDTDVLKQFSEVDREVPAISDDGEPITRRVKGYLLDDILKEYTDLSRGKLEGIKFIAGDGYKVEVAAEILRNEEIILAYEIDGEPLEDWEKPLRSVVPGEFTLYWVKNLVKIELVTERDMEEITRIVFIDSLDKIISTLDYEYHGEPDKVLRLGDIAEGMSDVEDTDIVLIKSIDGLEKREDYRTFLDAFLKIDGPDSPAFLSEDIPEGMWVKDIHYFLFGRTAYFSVGTGFKIMEIAADGGENYLKLGDIFEVCGIIDSESYLIRAIDGYSLEVDKESIKEGLINFDDDENISIHFDSLLGKTPVKYLLMIEVAK